MSTPEAYAIKLNRLLREARALTDPDTQQGRFTWSQFYFHIGHEDLRCLGVVKHVSTGTRPATWWVDPEREVTAQDVRELRAARRLGLHAPARSDPTVRRLALRIVEAPDEARTELFEELHQHLAA